MIQRPVTEASTAGSSDTVVIDASVAIPLLGHETLTRVARRVVVRLQATGALLVVPALFWLEVANTLRRITTTHKQAAEALYYLERFGLTTVDSNRTLLLLTVELAQRHRLTAYDAHYLALATAENARLATADRALARAAGDQAILIEVDRPGVHEGSASYGAASTDSGAWPGYEGYLGRLRAEVLSGR